MDEPQELEGIWEQPAFRRVVEAATRLKQLPPGISRLDLSPRDQRILRNEIYAPFVDPIDTFVNGLHNALREKSGLKVIDAIFVLWEDHFWTNMVYLKSEGRVQIDLDNFRTGRVWIAYDCNLYNLLATLDDLTEQITKALVAERDLTTDRPAKRALTRQIQKLEDLGSEIKPLRGDVRFKVAFAMTAMNQFQEFYGNLIRDFSDRGFTENFETLRSLWRNCVLRGSQNHAQSFLEAFELSGIPPRAWNVLGADDDFPELYSPIGISQFVAHELERGIS